MAVNLDQAEACKETTYQSINSLKPLNGWAVDGYASGDTDNNEKPNTRSEERRIRLWKEHACWGELRGRRLLPGCWGLSFRPAWRSDHRYCFSLSLV